MKDKLKAIFILAVVIILGSVTAFLLSGCENRSVNCTEEIQKVEVKDTYYYDNYYTTTIIYDDIPYYSINKDVYDVCKDLHGKIIEASIKTMYYSNGTTTVSIQSIFVSNKEYPWR